MTKKECDAYLAEVAMSSWDNLQRLAILFRIKPYMTRDKMDRGQRPRRIRNAIVVRMAILEREQRSKDFPTRYG